MTVLDIVLISIGLGCIAVLLVIGAIALVRDRRAERVDRAPLAEIVDQVKQHMGAEQGEEWTPRQT
ncbi:MAG: hypothetical protein GEV28_19855 [Actinophytocola sp.]|uniref:hypothetical protein n=1 Tax=Actinophytocola sp. TaxID=1872138 RepID=UPI00132A7550|nr:hypothetical protein [Actinophytocola sp.]MPZ82530.1 hypothetical protein [Actinophytocola sp.]